jgi:hypothetical protein
VAVGVTFLLMPLVNVRSKAHLGRIPCVYEQISKEILDLNIYNVKTKCSKFEPQIT